MQANVEAAFPAWQITDVIDADTDPDPIARVQRRRGVLPASPKVTSAARTRGAPPRRANADAPPHLLLHGGQVIASPGHLNGRRHFTR
jgi:hypothetical protein